MTTTPNTMQLSILLGVSTLIFGLSPLYAHAAEVYFKVVPNEVPGDEAVIIEAYIDPQQTKINAVEGAVHLESAGRTALSSVVVETGGSVLSWWPVVPIYSKEEGVVRFTGGLPNGFENTGLLFRMRLFASHEGTLTISWIGGAAYQNDGAGTKENISARSLAVSVVRGAPNRINAASRDSTPPSFDTVVIGHDEYLYDGKYFVSFHATDDVSGISTYEVREGGEITEVTDGVYVFSDQTRKTRVDITVYDHAGNSKSIQVPQRHEWTVNDILLISVAVLFLLFVGWHVYRKQKPFSI